jgi:hypothetical protein
MLNEVRIRVKERAKSSIGAPKSKHLADGFAANNRGRQIGGGGIEFDFCAERSGAGNDKGIAEIWVRCWRLNSIVFASIEKSVGCKRCSEGRLKSESTR